MQLAARTQESLYGRNVGRRTVELQSNGTCNPPPYTVCCLADFHYVSAWGGGFHPVVTFVLLGASGLIACWKARRVKHV